MNEMLPKAEGKYAWTVKIGEKGQFVIPKEAREIFGLHPGDTILVLGDRDQGLAIPPQAMFRDLAARIFGPAESEAADK